jgi:hypothetical protein
VLLLLPGQALELRNDDPLAHVVEAFAEGDELAFRLELALQGQVLPHRLRRPGRYRLASGSGNTWMSGYVVVSRSAHAAVTQDDGLFRIDGLAPGRYTVRLWHERLGERRVPVEVGAEGGRLDLTLEDGH